MTKRVKFKDIPQTSFEKKLSLLNKRIWKLLQESIIWIWKSFWNVTDWIFFYKPKDSVDKMLHLIIIFSALIIIIAINALNGR